MPVNHRTRSIYLASYAGMIVLIVLYVALSAALAPQPDEYGTYSEFEPEPPLAATCALVLVFPLSIVWIVCVLRWVHDAWSGIPEEHRQIPMFGTVSPGWVVGLFFVPCFNYLWMFLVNLGISDSLNRALMAQGSPERTSTGLAVGACCLQMVPYCNFLFAPILWFFWMRDADRARERLTEMDADVVAEVFS